MEKSNIVLRSICFNDFIDPLITVYNHHFCKTCLHGWLQIQQQKFNKIEWPLCRHKLDLMNQTQKTSDSSTNLYEQIRISIDKNILLIMKEPI